MVLGLEPGRECKYVDDEGCTRGRIRCLVQNGMYATVLHDEFREPTRYGQHDTRERVFAQEQQERDAAT